MRDMPIYLHASLAPNFNVGELGTCSTVFQIASAAGRFRTPPTPGEMKQALANQKPETVEGTAARPFAVMQIIATINDEGLGPLSWWDGAGEEEQEGEEAGEEEAADMDEEG